MTRRSLIKNMMGAIVGYAFLPKCLTESVSKSDKYIIGYDPYSTPGIGGSSFKVQLRKDWFNKGDLITCCYGQALLEEETETGFKGRFLNDGENVVFKFIEIEHTDQPEVNLICGHKVIEVHEVITEPIDGGSMSYFKEVPDLTVRKICSLYSEETEIIC